MYQFKVKICAFAILGLALIVPVIVLSQARPYYTSAFARYNVYEDFAQPETEVQTQFFTLSEYLLPRPASSLNTSFFSAEDIVHMQDVRNVFTTLYIFALASLAVIGICAIGSERHFWREAYRYLKKYFRFTLVFLLALGLIFALFWNQAFTLFHQVLFPFNTYWQLDPATSNLIKYFPPGIFPELGFLYLFQILLEYCAIHFAPRFKAVIWRKT